MREMPRTMMRGAQAVKGVSGLMIGMVCKTAITKK
jgi:hypothetical protein